MLGLDNTTHNPRRIATKRRSRWLVGCLSEHVHFMSYANLAAYANAVVNPTLAAFTILYIEGAIKISSSAASSGWWKWGERRKTISVWYSTSVGLNMAFPEIWQEIIRPPTWRKNLSAHSTFYWRSSSTDEYKFSASSYTKIMKWTHTKANIIINHPDQFFPEESYMSYVVPKKLLW